VFDAAVRRAGMLRVETLEDLFDAAETLAHARPVRGERLAIVTNGGGAGVLAADALSLGGGRLAALKEETVCALEACLPPTWSRGNPVDIIGDAPLARYQDALRILLAAPEVDAVVFAHAPTALVPAADIAGACLPLVQASAKPVLGCWLGGSAVATARAAWSKAGVPSFGTPERAVTAWLQMAEHARNQLALQQIPPAATAEFKPERDQARALLAAATHEGREWLDEVAAKKLLQAYGIPVVDTRAARDVEEAVRLAVDIGFPVALKVVSRQIIHKSDAGGVALNLRSRDEVRMAAIRMRQDVARRKPDASVNGFAVQAMEQRTGARELIVGISTDPVFGPVILCGSGGVDVELNRRSATALPPLNALLAKDLLARSGVQPLLRAWRSRAAANDQAVVDTLLKVSRMVCDLQDVAELDINPLLVDEHGVVALDARVRLHQGRARVPLAVRPYPEGLAEVMELAGSELLLRPIKPEDGERLRAFYEKASAADMRLRFFMSRREVPASELARYSQIDYDREMTFIALGPPAANGDRQMVGEVRAVCDPDNRTAEFAIQVASAWQGKGLGRKLLGKLVAYLRARGTQEIVGECLPENGGMAGLAEAMGFEVLPKRDLQSLRLAL
jgi:acetyltransferase